MADLIDTYFDVSSPYGYFAACKIEAITERLGIAVTWRPILLGAVFKVTGGQPWPSIPLKGNHAKRGLDLTARIDCGARSTPPFRWGSSVRHTL